MNQIDISTSRSKRERISGCANARPYAFSSIIFLAIMLGVIPIAFSQPHIVTGRITNELGEGIAGVNVVIKGSTIGTATDLNGRYTINLEQTAGGVIAISFIGYNTEEIAVGDRTVVDFQLTPIVKELQEVVVTGYNLIHKKDLASSVAVVDVDDMTKTAASNFADQLQGKVAGVQISTTGDPGSLQYVRVRGIGTVNNNEPLYVIDGVPVQNETDMNFLNPNDIETMQVLKDAAASIYGARAANGVVVITTKKGSGHSKFKFDFFTGMQDPQKFPEMANPSELLEIQKRLYAGANGLPFNSTFYVESPAGSGNWVLPDFLVNTSGYATDDPTVDPSKYVLNTSDADLYAENFPIAASNLEGTNWFNELFKPASLTSVQLSASGGNTKGSHYFSMNYFDYNGILIENEWQRIQARINGTFSPGNNFRLGENMNITYQTGKGLDAPRFNVESAYAYLPIVPVHDINGYWAAGAQSGQTRENPVAAQIRNSEGLDYHNLRLTGNVFAELDFLNYFSFRANAGLDYFEQPVETYLFACPECAQPGSNSLQKAWSSNRNWVVNTIVNFNKSMGNHTLYSLVGWEMRSAFNEGFNAQGRGLKYGDDPYYRELTNAQGGTYSIGSQSTNSTMVSVFANVNYTYREKYIFAATLRQDGSSKFINHKYGFFPGFSAAWRISQESFLRRASFITDLKLRASYGVSGNNEVLGGDYPGYSSYGTSPGLSSYAINGAVDKVSQGFAQVSSGNPDLKWETSQLINVAFDAILVKNLTLTLEWYSRKTKDMILGVAQPLETGNTSPLNQNIGSMINKGVDLQLSYTGKLLSQKLWYNVGLTGTHFTNKVLSLEAGTPFVRGYSLHSSYPAISRTQPGYPVSQFFGYVAEGLWTSQEEIQTILFANPGFAKPGRMKFRDVNGDGEITDEDRTFIGNPIPKFILGLNLSLNYKNFDVTAYFSGVFGQSVFNAVKSYSDFHNTNVLLSTPANRSKRMLYEEGKSLPVLDLTDTHSGDISSYFVEDASFFRCKNIVAGYTLPQKIFSKAGMTKCRTYFQIQNLFTLTKYSGLDPDVTMINYQGNQPLRDLTTGLDVGRYPLSTQFIIGLNIEF